MTKEDRQRLERIKEGIENNYYEDVDATPDLKFLWRKFQELLNK
jgi:hypothetical protein